MSMWSQKPTAGTNSALAQPDAISLGDAHAAAEPELSSNKNPLSRMDKIFFSPNCWLIVHFGDPGFSIALGLMAFQCHHCNCYFYGLLWLHLLGAEIAFHMTFNLGLHAQSWTLEALSMGNGSCNDKNNWIYYFAFVRNMQHKKISTMSLPALSNSLCFDTCTLEPETGG